MTSPSRFTHHFFSAWRGLTFRNCCRLLAQRPPVDLRYSGDIALLISGSIINSVLGSIENWLYYRQLHETTLHEEPVFILGHWRSGTTMLHTLLAQDPQFAYVNHYQAIFPHHFLLSEKSATYWTNRLYPSKRAFDSFKSGWSLPQEDEFALLAMTLQSPYLAVAFPNDEKKLHDCFRTPAVGNRELRKEWEDALRLLMKKVAFRSGCNRLLLKSPTHTSRLGILLKMFPQSRFIYITRHPYEVFASTLKMMTTMHKMLSFTDEFPNDIENHVLQAYRYYYYSYEGASAKRELNPDQLLEIRYEDVVQAPIEVCERIYQKLNIEGFEAAKPYLKKWADSQKDYRPQVYDLSDELKDRIYQQWKPAFDRFGYSR